MAAGDYVCKVVQRSHSKRLEIGLELSRRPDLGWNVAMTISQGLRRLGWSVPRMLDWNVVLGQGGVGGADGLKCSIGVHNDLRRVALQHFFSQSQPRFRERHFTAHGGIDLRGCRGMMNRPGRLESPAKRGRSI